MAKLGPKCIFVRLQWTAVLLAKRYPLDIAMCGIGGNLIQRRTYSDNMVSHDSSTGAFA